MSRFPRLFVISLALLIAATVGLAGWQLFAGDRLAEAGRWIDRAQEWQATLIVTAEAIEDETLKPADGGGFHVPWEGSGARAFPINADDVVREVRGMTAALPLSLSDYPEAAMRIDESHTLLQAQLQGIERLGPLASLDVLPATLRSAAIDVSGLIRPAVRLVADEAREAGLAKLALALAALACAALLIVLVVSGVRVRRERDRLDRHVQALRANEHTQTS